MSSPSDTWTCPQGHEVSTDYCPFDGSRRPVTPIERPEKALGQEGARPPVHLGQHVLLRYDPQYLNKGQKTEWTVTVTKIWDDGDFDVENDSDTWTVGLEDLRRRVLSVEGTPTTGVPSGGEVPPVIRRTVIEVPPVIGRTVIEVVVVLAAFGFLAYLLWFAFAHGS